MTKTILLSIFAVMGAVTMTAQNRNSVLQKINSIKGNSEEYYWYQFAHVQGDSAKHYATKFMLQDVNYGREENEKFSYEELKDNIKYECVNRGNGVQYLAYIKKSYVTRTKNVVETTGRDTSKSDPGTKVDPPKEFVPEGFVLRIKEVETFSNAYKLLRALQANGEVLQFGRLRDVEDYSSFDLILFDIQSQKILTVLSAEKAPGVRTDLLSGKDASLDNDYPKEMTAVIWYIRK